MRCVASRAPEDLADLAWSLFCLATLVPLASLVHIAATPIAVSLATVTAFASRNLGSFLKKKKKSFFVKKTNQCFLEE